MSVQSDLDIQFSSSSWAKKNRGPQRCEDHIKCIESFSQIVREVVPCQVNIQYGSGKRELIDIYGTDLPEDSPVFIYFHGGYWQEPGIRHNNNTFIAKQLYEHKIKSFFIGYELCPNVTLQQLAQNTENAVKMCLTFIKTASTKGIHLSGHSAGAQIVANLFRTFIPSLSEEYQRLFKTSFLITGVYDLVPLLKTSYNEPLKLDEESALAASPLHQVLTAKNCEMIIVVAEYESPKLLEQGEKMYQHVLDLKLQPRYVFLKDVDHFDVIEGLYDRNSELLKLIIECCIKK